MANQTITTDSNHDDLVGRLAGENITVTEGAKLTIDSYPQDTAMGLLGDIGFNVTGGEIHIDGRYVREVAYSSGSGTLPTVGDALTYGTSGTAKVINLTSGDNVSGVITITIQGDLEEPTGTITDGTWSATIDSSKVGLLKIFGEYQIWDASNATCTLRITGDWYEIGVGDGTDNQSINLPHTGRQKALWIETGAGTNVYQIWHLVNTKTSSVLFDSLSDWGDTYESGYVFSHIGGTDLVNFGTSTNGGNPPLGARIRIPNVHIGTTTIAAPQDEVISNAIGSHIQIIDSNVIENVIIDHLNASTIQVSLVQTNGATISDSVIGITPTQFIQNNPAPVIFTNCALVFGSSTLADDGPESSVQVTDNLGGITFTNCVLVAGRNSANSAVIVLTTMAGLTFNGTNKIVSIRQNENTFFAIRAQTSSRIKNNGTLLLLNGGVTASAGTVGVELGDIAYGQLSTRGSTEDTLNIVNIGATDTLTISSGRFLTGSIIEPFKGAQFFINDSANVTIDNFGSVSSKIDNGGSGSSVFNLSGISNNIRFRRCYFTNLGTGQFVTTVNSCSDILIQNCSTDYDDELEMDSSNIIIKGVHCGSGSLDTGTGVEADLSNVVGSVFYDHFKSDTAGAVGLVFSDPSTFYQDYFDITSGNPVFNGTGSLLMPNVGDQVVYEWPYYILGHTAFQNVSLALTGSITGNMLYEYDLDDGTGFTGVYQEITGANISAETISPTGFKLRIRITTQTAGNNSIDGFSIATETTISDQAANLYPLVVVPISATVLANSRIQLFNVTTDTEIDNRFVSTTSYSTTVSSEASINDTIRLRVTKKGYREQESLAVFNGSALTFLVTQVADEVYDSYGIDGDTITKFTPDYVNNQVDLVVSSNFGGAEFYAWYNANLATEDGIRNFFGAVTPIDSGNIRINSGTLDLKFDNTTSTNIFQNDNIRIFRTDSAYPVVNPTSGAGGIDLVWRNQVYISTGASGASDWTDTEKEQIRNRLGIDGDSSSPSATPTLALQSSLTTLIADVAALNNLSQTQVAQAVWNYLQSESTVSASMKEAVQQILTNAKLIPAVV